MAATGKSKRKSRQIDDATRQAAWDELARLLIRGTTQKKCAEMLGFHWKTIQGWIANPEFRLKLVRTRNTIFADPKDVTTEQVVQDIREKIKEYAREAIDKMYVIMQTGEHDRTQLKAAMELADRSPETQKTRNVKIDGRMMLFTAQDLALAAQAALEIKEDHELGHRVEPAKLHSPLTEALDIEAQPFEDQP